MKGGRIHYEPEELAWIEARKEWTRKELHAAFCRFWKRDDVSFDNFKALCTRKGWKTGRTGRIEPGTVPPNKGKPMPEHVREKCLKTAFKKGNVPHTFRGPGHERIDSKDGYVVVIVDEVNPWSGAKTRPVHKHRYLWEQKHGPIPPGHALKCLDGDQTNCDPSNWELVSRGVLSRLNSRWATVRFNEASDELKPTLLATARLKQAIHEIKKPSKGANT